MIVRVERIYDLWHYCFHYRRRNVMSVVYSVTHFLGTLTFWMRFFLFFLGFRVVTLPLCSHEFQIKLHSIPPFFTFCCSPPSPIPKWANLICHKGLHMEMGVPSCSPETYKQQIMRIDFLRRYLTYRPLHFCCPISYTIKETVLLTCVFCWHN